MDTTSAEQRERQQSGAVGEIQAANLLRLLGAQCVQRISTPWRIIRIRGKVVNAVPVGKVTGDFIGVLPGGRSLLVEVKRREDAILSWGDLEEHQHQAMMAHSVAGGASWVILAAPGSIMAMWYREMVAAGWRNKHPLHLADAERLRITGPA